MKAFEDPRLDAHIRDGISELSGDLGAFLNSITNLHIPILTI